MYYLINYFDIEISSMFGVQFCVLFEISTVRVVGLWRLIYLAISLFTCQFTKYIYGMNKLLSKNSINNCIDRRDPFLRSMKNWHVLLHLCTLLGVAQCGQFVIYVILWLARQRTIWQKHVKWKSILRLFTKF